MTFVIRICHVSAQKCKCHQSDCPYRRQGCWSLPSTSAVTIRTFILTIWRLSVRICIVEWGTARPMMKHKWTTFLSTTLYITTCDRKSSFIKTYGMNISSKNICFSYTSMHTYTFLNGGLWRYSWWPVTLYTFPLLVSYACVPSHNSVHVIALFTFSLVVLNGIPVYRRHPIRGLKIATETSINNNIVCIVPYLLYIAHRMTYGDIENPQVVPYTSKI